MLEGKRNISENKRKQKGINNWENEFPRNTWTGKITDKKNRVTSQNMKRNLFGRKEGNLRTSADINKEKTKEEAWTVGQLTSPALSSSSSEHPAQSGWALKALSMFLRNSCTAALSLSGLGEFFENVTIKLPYGTQMTQNLGLLVYSNNRDVRNLK